MPNEFPISPIGPAPHVTSREQSRTPDPARPPVAQPAQPLPNPSLRLDPALGLVVIEFRDDRGAVAQTYPSERQLAAYRATSISGNGTLPAAPIVSPVHAPAHIPEPTPEHHPVVSLPDATDPPKPS